LDELDLRYGMMVGSISSGEPKTDTSAGGLKIERPRGDSGGAALIGTHNPWED
jgi:hypothetical protein